METQPQQPAPIRILLVDVPSLLSGMIHEALRGRKDMQVVEPSSAPDLEFEVRQSRVDVVIAGLTHGVLPQAIAGLVAMAPPVAVVGVAQGGTRTIVELGDVSLGSLLEISRAAALAVRR